MIDRSFLVGGSDYARGVLLVMLAGMIWSLNGILIRSIESASDLQVAFYRTATLSVGFAIFLALRRRGRVIHAFRAAAIPICIAGVLLGFTMVLFTIAMIHTTIANALFILSASPLLAAVLARVLLRELIRPVTALAILCAIFGVGVMIGEGLIVGGLFGILMALATACSHASYAVSLRYGRKADMLPAICLGGFLGAGVTAALVGDFQVSANDFVLCLLMGVVSLGLGFLFFTIGSRSVPASELLLLSMTEAVLAPIWVWLGIGEVPHYPTLIGGAMVFGAIVLQAIWGIRSGRTGQPA